MGWRHYFVIDRLEELVDESDSRSSSPVHEHENFQLVSQNVAIQTPISTSSNSVDEPIGCPITAGLHVQSRSASTFSSVFLLMLNKQIRILAEKEENVCRFPDHSKGTFVLSQRVSSFCHDLDEGVVGLVGWLTSACRAPSKPKSYIQSCLTEIFGGTRSDAYTFSNMISPVHIHTTLGIQYVSGKVSSEVTKVPLAELRRLFVMESTLSEYMERKDRKKTVTCKER